MGKEMDGAGEAFVKAANAVDSDLDEAGTKLDSSGFQDAIKDLGAAEEALDEAASAVASAFDSVASGVTSLATELAAGLQDAAGKAGAAGGELDGHAQDIETEGQAAVQAVTAACNEQAAAYQGMKGDLDGFYEGQKGAVLSEGDSFKDCVRKLLEAQDEQARTSQVEPLSGPMDIIIDTVLEPHNQELDKWEDTVAKAAEAADEIKELVSDLKRSKKVAEQIDEVGKAVGGG
jgi:hypothetical protein